MATTMLQAAQQLAKQDYSVFPIKPLCKSPPLIKGWQNAATTDPKQIDEWWTSHPDANIGIACGLSDIRVVDLDRKNGIDGVENFDAIAIKLGIPTDTYHVATPHNGIQMLYASNDPTLRNTGQKSPIVAGVDTRGDGGYIVAPPSIVDGKRYTWDTQYQTLAPLPAEIVKLWKAAQNKKNTPTYSTGTKDEFLGEANSGRNGYLISLAGKLQARGETDEDLEKLVKACNAGFVAPLTEAEVMKVVKSAWKYEKGTAVHKAGKREYPQAIEYITALDKMGYSFKLNTLVDTVEVNGIAIDDITRSCIKSKLRDIGLWRVDHAMDAIDRDAYYHRYHPIKQYLEGLTWDGLDHIAQLGTCFTDAKNVFPLFFRRWAIGSVAKVYDPARNQNRMLVLDGKQDIGKSHFAKWLLPESISREYGVEGPIQPDNKDHLIRLAAVWLWEVAELGSTTRKADREALKSFLTLGNIRVRKPFGRDDIRKTAMASFLGTINDESGFLSDPTGHRRFMVVNLTSINWGYEDAVDIDQLWAQAYSYYKDGETGRLTPAEKDLADDISKDYEITDLLEDYLRMAYKLTGDGTGEVSTRDILQALHLAGWPGEKSQRSETYFLGQTCKRLNLAKARIGSSTRGYSGLVAR